MQERLESFPASRDLEFQFDDRQRERTRLTEGERDTVEPKVAWEKPALVHSGEGVGGYGLIEGEEKRVVKTREACCTSERDTVILSPCPLEIITNTLHLWHLQDLFVL